LFNEKLLTAYFDRFINRIDIWPQQRINRDGEFGYCYMKQQGYGYSPLTLETVANHLAGKLTLSLTAVDEAGMSKWCAWDSDTESGAIPAIQSALAVGGYRTFREGVRKGRDGHLWLLLDQKLLAADLLRFNQEVLAQARVATSAVEFFPKYPKGLSQLRAPLGIHRKPDTGNPRGWFEDAPKLVPVQLAWLAHQEPNDSAKILNVVRLLRQKDRALEAVQPRGYVCRRDESNRNYERLNLIEIFGDRLRRRGNEYVGQCPVCALEGHDRHCDNLRVSLDGSKFVCVFGGPGQVHKAADIIKLIATASVS
jgi:hypothetical protein